jgi:hypothetical protein
MAVDPNEDAGGDTGVDTGVIPANGALAAGAAADTSDMSTDMPTDDDNSDQNQPQGQGDLGDATDAVKGALAYGRAKYGMPPVVMAAVDQRPLPGAQTQDNSEGQWTGQGLQRPAQGVLKVTPKAFNPRDFLPKSSDAGSNVQGAARGGTVKGMADGGDMMDPKNTPVTPAGGNIVSMDQGGVMPSSSGGMPQPQQGGLKTYLTGQDAIPPDAAQALESKVDPQGQMEPNERKLRAVASAPDKDSQFGLMQYYRQRFNAHSAFAQAAAKGSPQKPPDLNASTQAATQAYHNLPDGNAMTFTPTKSGVHVNVRDLTGGGSSQPQDGSDQSDVTAAATGGAIPDPKEIPYRTKWREKNGKKAGPQPTEPKGFTKAFAAGGAVPDDSDPQGMGDPGGAMGTGPEGNNPVPVETTPESPDQAVDPNAIAGAIGSDPANAGNPGIPSQPYQPSAGTTPYTLARDAAGAAKDFVMSIPQYLGFLGKHGQYDAVMDKGAESAIQDAVNDQSLAQPMQTGQQPVQAGGQQVGAPSMGSENAPYTTAHGGENWQNLTPAGGGSGSASQQPDPDPSGNDRIVQLPRNPTPQQIRDFNASNGGAAARQRFNQQAASDDSDEGMAQKLYPWASQAKERAAYVRAQAGEKQTQGNAIDLQKLKNEGQIATWGARGQVQQQVAATKDAGATQRANIRALSAQEIARGNNVIKTASANQQQGISLIGKMLVANPELANDPEQLMKQAGPLAMRYGLATRDAILAAQQGLQQGNVQAPNQQTPQGGTQQPQQSQRKFYNGQWYTRGPNGEAVPASQ